MAKESYASRYRQVKHHLHTLLAQKKIVLMGKIGNQVNDQRFLLMVGTVATGRCRLEADVAPLRTKASENKQAMKN